MKSTAKSVSVTEQAHHCLEECAYMGRYITHRRASMKDCASLAILLYYLQLVELMEAMGITHTVDPELVQAARCELESLQPELLKAMEEEKARTAPEDVVFDIT